MSKTMMKAPPDLPEPVGAVCPYCKQTLDKTPKRKKKCPSCGNYIYVRTLPSGDRPRVLVTEDGAKQIEKEWQRVHFRQKWMQLLEGCGLSGRDFDRHMKMLRGRFGQEPGDGDIIWSMFNDALRRAMKDGDLQELKMLYFDMALFLCEEGRPFFHILQQSRRMELMHYREMFVRKVQICTARDASCETCRKLHGKVLKRDDALQQMPIPSEDCAFELSPGTPGWCRCVYLAVVQ